jgi:hypothetical protein
MERIDKRKERSRRKSKNQVAEASQNSHRRTQTPPPTPTHPSTHTHPPTHPLGNRRESIGVRIADICKQTTFTIFKMCPHRTLVTAIQLPVRRQDHLKYQKESQENSHSLARALSHVCIHIHTRVSLLYGSTRRHTSAYVKATR